MFQMSWLEKLIRQLQDSTNLLGRISRYPLRILPGKMAVPILQGPLKGKKWIIGSQRHAFWLGIYEPHMQKLISEEVKSDAVFYDVGANVGFYSLLASILVGPGKVFAFEPLPSNVSYLHKHLTLNAVKNVEVLELAICDLMGVASFELEGTGAMGRLQEKGTLRVTTAGLDSLLQEQRIAPPDYIKMDIEGAECKALVGAKLCFQKYKPVLFLATHGREVHKECCDLLRSWNYELQVVGQASQDRAEVLCRSKC
jgi:FkbM family methyltransferase